MSGFVWVRFGVERGSKGRKQRTGEASNAQDSASTEVQGRGSGRVGLGQAIGTAFEILGDGDEGLGVLGRGAVVDVVLNQVLEDGFKVFIGAVVEGIHRLGALQKND